MADRSFMGIVWSIMWLLLIIFLGFWIAGFCAFAYIIINMFIPCCPGCEPASDLLLSGIKVTGKMSQWMVNGLSPVEAFKGPDN